MYRGLYVVLGLIAVSTVSVAVNERYVIAKCKNETNVSDEVAKSLLSQDLDPYKCDTNAKCFVACWLDHAGILKSDGAIDVESITSELEHELKNKDEFKNALRKCSDEPGEGCTKKFNIATCLKRVRKQEGV